MPLKFIVLLTLTSAVLAVLKNLRLQEIEKLIDKFDSTIDVNYLFYDKVREEQRNPLHCTASNGPSCLSINKQSLQGKVKKGNETLLDKSKKIQVIEGWDRLRQQESTTLDRFFVINNNERDSILKLNPTDYKGVDSRAANEALLQFEELPLTDSEKKVEIKFQFEFMKSVAETSSLTVSFENIYQPSQSNVYNKRSIAEAAKLNKQNVLKQDLEPEGAYVFTKKDSSGYIHFSRPVRVKSIFARKHNLIYYQDEQRKLGKSPDKIELSIFGLNEKKEKVVEFKKETFSNQNKFLRLESRISEEDAKISSLFLNPNTDVDNIQVYLVEEKKDTKTISQNSQKETGEKSEKIVKEKTDTKPDKEAGKKKDEKYDPLFKSPSLEDLQGLMSSIANEINQHQSLPYEELKVRISEIGEEYLQSVGFDEDFAKELMGRLILTEIKSGVYQFDFEAADLLRDLAPTIDIEMLTNMKNNPEILHEVLRELLTGDQEDISTDEAMELLKALEDKFLKNQDSEEKPKDNSQHKQQINKDL